MVASNSLQLLSLPQIEQNRPTHNLVYEGICSALRSGLLEPGQKIVMRDLASALGTSVMPVREALRRLEADYAVEQTTTSRTLCVPVMSPAGYEELYLIRSYLEGLAAAEAGSHVNEAELNELARNVERATDAGTRNEPDYAMVATLNFEFHRVVAHASRRPLLIRIIEGLWLRAGPQVAYAIKHGFLNPDLMKMESWHPHRRILDALRAGDGAGAAAAISHDIKQAGERITSYLKSIDGRPALGA
jgi:DNA-binding GntR family transcriptional regulator